MEGKGRLWGGGGGVGGRKAVRRRRKGEDERWMEKELEEEWL